MPYGTKAKEMRDLLLKLRTQEKEKSKQTSLLEESEEKPTSKIFDSSTDPFEMCDPNVITKTSINMNKLRRMKK